MVINHLRNMFSRGNSQDTAQTAPEDIGVLYIDGTVKFESSSIDFKNDTIFFTSSKDKVQIPIKKIDELDFTETVSKDPALSFRSERKEYLYVFKSNLPSSAIQFYGKVSEHVPAINKWEVLLSTDHVKLLVYDYTLGNYVVVDESVSATIYKKENKGYLRVYNQYKIYRKGDSTSDSSEFYIDQAGKSFSWAVQDKSSNCIVFRIVFPLLPMLFSFFSFYLSSSRKEERDDAEYFEKLEMENYYSTEGDSGEERDREEEKKREEEEEREREEEDERKREKKRSSEPVAGNVFGGRSRERNRALAVTREKAFISRGSSIGVFGHEDDDLEFKTSVTNISSKGNRIEPKKILAADGGTSLLLTESARSSNVHKLDLNTGKIAETWNTGEDTKDLFSEFKDSQGASAGNEFLGITGNSIYKIDPRSKDVVEGKKYATSTKFTSGDANAKGEFAIGSEKGEIRMYDKLDKRAKTLLPGLGDPITGVFVSPSGKYVVCTCKSYLVLVAAESSGVSGFRKSLGKDKPAPKKLTIRPEHRQEFGKEIEFTNASISTDEEERFVVVSTGEWVIIWDISKVLKGEVFSYQIRKNEHKVVSNSFIPGESRKIVVAMEDDIQVVSRNSMKSPNVFQYRR